VLLSNKAFWYTVSQLAAKSMAAGVQFYAIYVFTKIHGSNDAALILLLLGYAIWVQVFEFGLSQVLQNGYNGKRLSLNSIYRVVLFHFLLMIFICAILINWPDILKIFFGLRIRSADGVELRELSIGVALMLVATNNVLIQRVLLVLNRQMIVSRLIALQALMGFGVLSCLLIIGSDVEKSIVFYLSVPVLVHAPVLIVFLNKTLNSRTRQSVNWNTIIRGSVGFCGLTILSTIYLGADYFFIAKYLQASDLISYHFSSRLFFISYVVYYSYLQFQAKNISKEIAVRDSASVWVVIKDTIKVGFSAVIAILAFALFLLWMGASNFLGVGGALIISMVCWSAFYYAARVVRDVGVVLAWNMDSRGLLYTVHGLEVAFGIFLLSIFTPRYGGAGAFGAMAGTSLLSAIVVFICLGRIMRDVPMKSYNKLM
jgi:O-antigen/teichoic acid export membrane protein